MWFLIFILQQFPIYNLLNLIGSCMPFNQLCDSFPGSKMFMSGWNDTDSGPGDLYPMSASRQQMRQGQCPAQQRRDEGPQYFDCYADYYRNMQEGWDAPVQGQGSQSRNIQNGSQGVTGMQSNVGPSQPKDGMIARVDQSNRNIGSEAGNVTRMRSQYPPCQYMEDSPNVQDQSNYGFNRYPNMLSSCDFAPPVWNDGESRNSRNDFSQHQRFKNMTSSNPHPWNWSNTGASYGMPMNAGQPTHGVNQRYGSRSAGSGFPSTQYCTNRPSCEFNKSSKLQQISFHEPSTQYNSMNRPSCEFGQSSQLQQPSHREQLPVDPTLSVLPNGAVGPNEGTSNNNPQIGGMNVRGPSSDDSFEYAWMKSTTLQSNGSDLLHPSQLNSSPQDPLMIPNATLKDNIDQQIQAMYPRWSQSNGDSVPTSTWDGASTSVSIQHQPDQSMLDVNQDGSSKQLPNSLQTFSDLHGIDSTQPLLPQQSNLPQQQPAIFPDPSTDPTAAAQKTTRPKTSCGK